MNTLSLPLLHSQVSLSESLLIHLMLYVPSASPFPSPLRLVYEL